MFIAEALFDLGDLGSRDGLILGSVAEDEDGNLHVRVKKINIDLDGALIDATKLLEKQAMDLVIEKLTNKYIAARDRNTLRPEDWSREGA